MTKSQFWNCTGRNTDNAHICAAAVQRNRDFINDSQNRLRQLAALYVLAPNMAEQQLLAEAVFLSKLRAETDALERLPLSAESYAP